MHVVNRVSSFHREQQSLLLQPNITDPNVVTAMFAIKTAWKKLMDVPLPSLCRDSWKKVARRGTELATAQCATIRLKLFKIGALIRITVRKVWIALSSGCPYAGLFCRVHAQLAALPLRC